MIFLLFPHEQFGSMLGHEASFPRSVPLAFVFFILMDSKDCIPSIVRSPSKHEKTDIVVYNINQSFEHRILFVVHMIVEHLNHLT